MIEALGGAWTLDGAVGTALLTHGADPRDPEGLVESAPDVVRELHRSMVRAGAGCVTAASFAAPRISSAERRVERAVAVALEAGAPTVLAALGPGRGHASLARVALGAGAAAVVLETFVDPVELLRATVSVRAAIGDAPLIAGLCPLDDRVDTDLPRRLRDAGADALLLVCGNGAGSVVHWALAVVDGELPVLARPSAGLPEALRSPGNFRDLAERLRAAGVAAMGGCCGTTAAHVQAIAEAR